MNTNDFDKIKIPKELEDRVQMVYKSYERKKRRDPAFLRVAAACLIVFMAGFAFPGYTQNLPIYSKIFSLFDRTQYEEYSDELSIESKSNGIKITLSDMIYTGDVLSYGYVIESDKYLGKEVNVDWQFDGNVMQRSGFTSVRYQGDNTYVGWAEWYLGFNDDTKDKKTLDFVLCAEEIESMNEGSTLETIKDFDGKYDNIYKGDWKFPIHIKQIQGGRVIRLNQISQNTGFTAQLHQIFIDKVGTKFKIKIKNEHGYPSDMYEVDLAKIYDEDGKVYETDDLGQVVTTIEGFDEARFQLLIPLKPGTYKLVFELSKTQSLDYYDVAGKLVDEPYDDSEEFKKAPEKVEMSIPFEITQAP